MTSEWGTCWVWCGGHLSEINIFPRTPSIFLYSMRLVISFGMIYCSLFSNFPLWLGTSVCKSHHTWIIPTYAIIYDVTWTWTDWTLCRWIMKSRASRVTVKNWFISSWRTERACINFLLLLCREAYWSVFMNCVYPWRDRMIISNVHAVTGVWRHMFIM